MRQGTIAFLLGVLAFQTLAAVPDVRWGLLLIPLVPLAVLGGRLRFPLAMGCGFLWALVRAAAILAVGLAPALEGQDVVLDGAIASIPEQRGDGVRFEFEVERLEYRGVLHTSPGRVRLSWRGGAPPRVGDRWRITARLRRPHGYMNPGGFDYEAWLFQNRLRATGYVREDAGNRLTASGGDGLQRLRQRLGAAIEGALPGSSYIGIVAALAIGDRQHITPAQWEALRRTGTNHLVAISGLHIGLVAGLAFLLVRRAWPWAGRAALYWPAPKAGAVAALAAALAYAALAGFSIPTQRALVMVGVVMAGVLRQRTRSLSHTWCAALLVVLIFDPLAVLAPGFWLSYCAVGAILFATSHRLAAVRGWRGWGRLHVVVALGLLPLMLVLYQRQPLLSPLANLIAVPWVSLVVVPLTLLGASCVLWLPPLGTGALWLAERAFALLWPALHWLADIPTAQWTQHAPLAWTLLPAFAGTALLLAPRGVPGRWLGAVWLLPALLAAPPRPAEGEAWFTLLDVGQGLAAVVQTRDHVLVYDTGPRYGERFDTGGAVVAPFLRRRGIARIDTLVVGHGDNDHIGGAASLLREVAVARVITSVPQRLPEAAAERCAAGQEWRWNGVEFRMLHPPPGRPGAGNNGSCVLRIAGLRGAILLPGDIERGAERTLVQEQRDRLSAAILVAPHHGSATSSTQSFLDAVRPEFVLFPIGYRNRYGFPRPEVVARTAALGARRYDSACHGAISFVLGARAAPDTYRQSGRRYWHAPCPSA